MQHFRVLEFWRLSAAVAVMVFHYLRYAPPGYKGVEEVLFRMLPLMDMFFMISGFLIMLRYGDKLLDGRAAYRSFIVKRMARIYPIYLATLAFFVVIGIAIQLGHVHSGWEGRFNFWLLPHNLLLIQAWGTTDVLTFNYVAWTLSAEWFCYLFFPVIVVAYQRAGVAGLVLLTALLIAVLHAAMLAGLFPEGHWLHTNSKAAYRAFADFSIGALIAVLVRSSKSALSSHLPGWLAFVGSIAAMLTQQNPYLVLGLLALAVYFSALAERNNPNGARFLVPLSPIGQVSFGIYILHPVVEVIFFSVIWRMGLEHMQVMSFFLYWYIPMAVAILAALASDRWFERPVGKWLVALSEKRAQRRVPSAVEPAE